jgi:hypothetical protein
MEVWEIDAREQARDLVARYNACGDADLLDEMVALFARDAVMDVGAWGCHEGIEAIRSFFEGVRRNPSQTEAGERRLIRHFTATHRIDVDSADGVRGQCYYQVLTNEGLDHWGRYVDVYGLEDARFRFKRRTVFVDGMTAGGWAEARMAQTGDAS